MHYKSIIMELIDDQPELALQLRGKKQMLATIETYAMELKNRHEAWKKELSQTRPGSDPSQIAPEALELAIAGPTGPFSPPHQPTDEDGRSFPRRGDGVPPPTHAARVKASRGQATLPFIVPAWQRASSAPPEPAEPPGTAAVAASPADLLSSFDSGPAWAFLRDATAAAGPGNHRPYVAKRRRARAASRRARRCRFGRTRRWPVAETAPG